ncbi:hypothetical protein LOD99_6976 [Oopsacas minuta]|uniref:Ig-like domain-containing protein n=1 Tax=Oopsacas minuta TaxID=111878 RepID=A0AAV7JJ86_9METZ|nr:hypothetical protein LOD99_6976 [Oopsacas minuta]
MTFLIFILLLWLPLTNSLSFISEPVDRTISIHFPVEFNCFVSHTDAILLIWSLNTQRFSCNGDCFPSLPGYVFETLRYNNATHFIMTIEAVNLTDNGTVSCIATELTSTMSITSTVVLIVNDVLDFLKTPGIPDGVEIILIGYSILFVCEVNKQGGTFVWKRRGSVVPDNPRYTYSTTPSKSSLNITSLTAVDIGEFVCEVTLASEVIASSPAIITLADYNAPSIQQGLAYEVNVIIGPQTVTCPVLGNPLPTEITWSQDGVTLPTSSTSGPYSNSGILQFDTSRELDTGKYDCTASNGLHTVNGTVYVEVTGLTGILTQWYVIMGLIVACLAVSCVGGAFVLSLVCCYIDQRSEDKLTKKYEERIKQVKSRRAERAREHRERFESAKTTQVSTIINDSSRPSSQPTVYKNIHTDKYQYTDFLKNPDGSVTYSVKQDRVQIGGKLGKRPNTVAEIEIAPIMEERPPTHLRLPRHTK